MTVVHRPVAGWAHLTWSGKSDHEGRPVRGSLYIQPGTRNVEATCSGCTRVIVAFYFIEATA